MGAREDGLAEGIPVVRHHDRDARSRTGPWPTTQRTPTLDERDVADAHPGHVADGVAGTRPQQADADAQVPGAEGRRD